MLGVTGSRIGARRYLLETTMLEIRRATTMTDFDSARALVTSFVAWLRVLYRDNPAPVDEYFQAIQPELAGFPGEYAPPNGRMLLAVHGGRPVGMVAFRKLGQGVCEMKRMFVDSSMHGGGVGRALAEALLEEARQAGYSLMRLDISHRQAAAIGLYRKLGFKEIQPYYAVSESMLPTLIFMERSLQPSTAE